LNRLSAGMAPSPGFEVNTGQMDAAVRFARRGRSSSLFLTRTSAVLALGTGHRAASVQMDFIGGHPRPRLEPSQRLPGMTNYFIGNDPAKWHPHVAAYANVKYEGVYPGIDVVFHTDRGDLEYDFVVAPGGDPANIAVSFRGARGAHVDRNGDLVLDVGGGEVRQKRPFVSQVVDGRVNRIDGRYVLAEGQTASDAGPQVRFSIGPYDASRTLVIDPVLVFSTYFGGSAEDRGVQVEVDESGIYILGQTMSVDLPNTSGGYQPVQGGDFDAFVAKFTRDGGTLVYCTYLGGSGTEDPFLATGFAVDKHGNVIVAAAPTRVTFPRRSRSRRATAVESGMDSSQNSARTDRSCSIPVISAAATPTRWRSSPSTRPATPTCRA